MLKSQLTVGIADMKISANPEESIVTYSLGSCLGVSVFDPVARVGGIIHCMLPISKVNPEKALIAPYMFVDTGIPLFLQHILDAGAQKQRLKIKAAGCSSLMDEKDIFNIGERNWTIFRKIIWKNGMLIDNEDIGGVKSRTMTLYLDTGKTTIKAGGEVREL